MPARGYSVSAPRKPRAKARPKPVVVPPSEATGERAAVRSNSKRRLEAQVKTQRAKVKAGTGVKGDTGDVLKGAKVKRKPEPGALKKELEGRGFLAKASKVVGEHVVELPHIKTALKAAGVVPGLGDLDRRYIKDLINLPAQAIPSAYVPVASVVEAAKGRPQRAVQFAKDVKESDPVVNLVTGHPKKALELAKEHPGFTAVEVAGLKGSVGRGVTRVQRVAGRRPGVRPSAKLPGTTLEQPREYSRDAFARARQKRSDKAAAARAARLRTMAKGLEDKDPGAHSDRIDELRSSATKGRVSRLPNPRLGVEGETMRPGRLADPERMTDQEVRRRAAERVAVNEQVRRENRQKVGAEVKRALVVKTPVGKAKPSAATTLAIQNITDRSPTDLAAYKREIASQFEGLGAEGRRVNRRLQAEIQKAIDKHPDPAALQHQIQAYGDIMRPRTQALVDRGMLPKESADKAPLVPYAVRKMGAKITEEGPVHTDTGAPIKATEIRAHMRERGVSEPSYVTQAPERGGAFFVSSSKPQNAGGPTRTGGATARGTFSAHPDVLAEGAARAQGLIDAADGFKATVHEFAHQPTLGKLKTKVDADRKARELSAETGVEYRPIRINPFAGRQEQLQALLDNAGDGPDQPLGQLQPVREALEGAYRGEDGPGPWALIPRAAADEFAAHTQRMGAGPASKVGQLVGQSFRRAVLATSPTWFAGNIIEAGLRSTLAGAGPRSFKLGRDVLARVDKLSPQLGQELRARAAGGGHFKSADTLHVRRGAEQFQGTQLEPLARSLHKFWNTPGPREVSQVWNRWTDLVFRQVNGRIESGFQTAMLGRALRNSPLMDGDMPKLSAKAVDQAARGLLNTNEQAALGRKVERMYGKYNGFTAGTRWAIAMYTPFIPWTLNAVRFVFDVLPRDHPTVTALIAATEQATDEWRKDHGLDLFIDEAVPGFLQGSIPLKGGRHQRAPFRYTPFGAFGDPLDTAAKSVLPQYQGVLAAFKGEDWKGAKLRDKQGNEADTLGKAKAAAQSFAEATVPLLGIIKRVAEKGPQALNPLAPTAPPKVKVKTGRGGSGGGVDQDIDRLLDDGGGTQRDIDALLGGL